MMFTPLSGQERAEGMALAEAQAYCRRLARSHYENFTVGSWFLPRWALQHTYNIYAYCRTVDDLGDEAAGDRLALLDQWEEDVHRCYMGDPRHPVLLALQETIRQYDIPSEPFLKLIEANRTDQRQARHPTYADLLHYCDHSANPVGHLVLYLFGYRDQERQALADRTCTALQLANFWQDVNRDYKIGRIYLPQEDMARHGYSESDLAAGRYDERFANLLRELVGRTRDLFAQGLPLVSRVDRRLAVDIELFSRGGLEILRRIELQNYNVLARRPQLDRESKALLLASTLLRHVFRRPT